MSADESKTAPQILGMGNPLLDISAEVPASLLEKYGVTLNNAILAEEKHLPVYDELVASYSPEFIAGGATQNSVRVAQWIFGDKSVGRTAYIGCIGNDDYGRQLTTAAAGDGVSTHYLVDEETPTGTCAVLINDTERSLVANLAAANKYDASHFATEDIKAVLADSSIVYSSGFFLTVSVPSMVAAGKHCAENGKTYALNLAAPFIPQFFKEQLGQVMYYADIVIGNESESAAYAEANGLEDKSAEGVARHIAAQPKANGTRGRLVIITHGGDPTLVLVDGKVRMFDCEKLEKTDIVDSNGAGDAFVGGFLSQYALGKSLDDCMRCGNYCAHVILKRSGCSFPSKDSGYKA